MPKGVFSKNVSTKRVLFLFLGVAAILLASCGGSVSQVAPPGGNPTSAAPGEVFVVGTDAPLASVLAFKVTFNSLTVSDGANTANLISSPQDIEFARLNGLRTLLTLQSVPAGNYTSVTATLSSPVISFFDNSTTPPSVQTLNGTLTQSTVTVPLPQPLVVTSSGLVGIHLDFRLRNSIQVDAGGQITGTVNPQIAMRAIPPDAPEAEIDEVRGGVVSVDLAGNSFVMQGPHGRNLTVQTDGQTEFEPGEGLSTLTASSIVSVSGFLQRVTRTLRATEVIIVSQDRFLVGGLVTDVRPATGSASAVDLLVRTELPDLTGVQVGRISTLALDGNERYMIHHLRLPIANLLFGDTSLIRGQRLAIGGALTGSSLDARRVVLARQGIEGGWIPGSTSISAGNNGSFDLNANGLTGLVFGGPVRVVTSDRTRFIHLRGLQDLAGASPIRIRVVGLVLHSPLRNAPVVVAWSVEALQ